MTSAQYEINSRRFKHKTDPGKVFYGDTLRDGIPRGVKVVEVPVFAPFDHTFSEGYKQALEDCKDLMYHVYGLDPDSSIWDGLGKRGR